MRERLEDIGNRLGLSERDIRDVAREGRRYRTLFFLGGAILALIAFIIGLLLGWITKKDSGGSSGGSGGGYPYASMAVGSVGGLINSRPSRIALVLTSMAAFMAGISMPVYGEAIDYGVFRKRGG